LLQYLPGRAIDHFGIRKAGRQEMGSHSQIT
jgi:hypothetical protein